MVVPLLLDDIQVNGGSLLPSEDANGDVPHVEGTYLLTYKTVVCMLCSSIRLSH